MTEMTSLPEPTQLPAPTSVPVTYDHLSVPVEFRREIQFHPGFALTDPQRGRSAMKIAFYLHGPKATIQFVISTGWTPEKVKRRVSPAREWSPDGFNLARIAGVGTDDYDVEEWMHTEPMGFDVGYHADADDEYGSTGFDKCDVRPSGRCFYDGSSLAADRLLTRFFVEGDAPVWAELEEWYRDRFGPQVTV